MKRHNALEQYIFLAVVLVLFAWAAYEALNFPTQAQTFPRSVALVAVAIVLLEMVAFFFTARGDSSSVDTGAEEDAVPADSIRARFSGILPYLLWIGAFYVGIYLIGMVAASGIFMLLFLLLPGKMKWYYALLAAILTVIFLITMEDVMSLRWPRSIIDPIEMLGLH